jgi:SPP1 gp7 family putative phage head morphogenesis protein
MSTFTRRPVVVQKVGSREVLVALAIDLVPQFKQAFLRGVATLQTKEVRAKVEAALQAGDVLAAEAALDWTALGLQASLGVAMRDLMERAMQHTVRTLQAAAPSMAMRFDLPNPQAVLTARRQAANLVKYIDEQQRQAIREIVRDAMEHGGHPYQTAKLIQQYIGLDPRRVLAVENHRKALLAQGIDGKVVDKRVQEYTARQLLDRAEVIARTETMNASNSGQRELWRLGVQDGTLNPAEWKRQWITARDSRVCDKCADLEGELADINGPYPDGSDGPPKHPRCRCIEVLVRVQ